MRMPSLKGIVKQSSCDCTILWDVRAKTQKCLRVYEGERKYKESSIYRVCYIPAKQNKNKKKQKNKTLGRDNWKCEHGAQEKIWVWKYHVDLCVI